MHTNQTIELQRTALQTHIETLRTAAQRVQDLPDTLRYERRVSPDTCAVAITDLRLLQAVVQTGQVFAENHPLIVAPTARVALACLESMIDEAVLYLVAVREEGGMTVEALRVRKQALRQLARVLLETEETLDELAAGLLTAKHGAAAGKESHLHE